MLASLGWQWFQHATTPAVHLRNGQTIRTADDASYLRPIDQWMEQGYFPYQGKQGREAIVRSPGYGLWYGLHRLVFKTPERCFWAMRISQAGLQALALVLILAWANTALGFRLRPVAAAPLLALPFFYGFSSFTLTEGISPFLVALGLFSLQQFEIKNRYTWAGLVVLAFGWMWLSRPALLPLGLAFVPLFIRRPRQAILVLMLSLLPLAAWMYRSEKRFGIGWNLHPIYQSELPGQYRAPHAAAWGLFKGWEHKGARFHSCMDGLYEQALRSDSVQEPIQRALGYLPEQAVQVLGREALEAAFLKYIQAVRAQHLASDQGRLLLSGLLPEEQVSVAAFDSLKHEFRTHAPFDYFVGTPAKVAWELMGHSNLNAYFFQHRGRGRIWVEALRYLCFLLHASAWIFSVWFMVRRGAQQWAFLGIAVYVFYLIFVQRGIEERYTLPFLAVVVVCMCICIAQYCRGLGFGRRSQRPVPK